MTEYNCLQCNSQNTKRLNLVYSEGKSRSGKTVLAERCKPPSGPQDLDHITGWISLLVTLFFVFVVSPYLAWKTALSTMMQSDLFIVGIGVGVVAFFVFAWFSMSITVTLMKKVFLRKAYRKYEEKREEWQNSWICMKCGNIFII